MKKTVKKKTLRERKSLHFESAASYLKKKRVTAGRPSKYDESMVGKVDEYLDICGRENTRLPTRQGLALFLSVDEDTLNNWGKEHGEFFGALKKLMLRQAEQLIDDGIYGGKEVNSTIVKLLLQNNHGMKERVDQTTNDKSLPTPIYAGRASDSI